MSVSDIPAPPVTITLQPVKWSDEVGVGTTQDISLDPGSIPNIRVGKSEPVNPIVDMAEESSLDIDDSKSDVSAGTFDEEGVPEVKRAQFFKPVDVLPPCEEHNFKLEESLIYVPNWVQNKRKRGDTEDDWVVVRPEMFFAVKELDSIELNALLASNKITKTWFNKMLPLAKENSPMPARPVFIVGSDTMGYDDSNVRNVGDWSKDLAMQHYLVAQIGTYFDSVREKEMVKKLTDLMMSVTAMGTRCPVLAKGGLKILRSILWMVKRSKFERLNKTCATWYTGSCSNKNKDQKLPKYFIRTKKARKYLFGDDGQHVWEHYSQWYSKGKPSRFFPIAKKAAATGLSYARVAANAAVQAASTAKAGLQGAQADIAEKTAETTSWSQSISVACSVGLKHAKHWSIAGKDAVVSGSARGLLAATAAIASPFVGVVQGYVGQSWDYIKDKTSYSGVSDLLWANHSDDSGDYNNLSLTYKTATGILTLPIWAVFKTSTVVTYGVKSTVKTVWGWAKSWF